MIALSHTTRPLRREKLARDAFHKLRQPLVETVAKAADNEVQAPTYNRPTQKLKTQFNSRALWRHSYCRSRKKASVERAVSGDWRVFGLNKTPIIARAENVGFAIIASSQERVADAKERDLVRYTESRRFETRNLESAQARHQRRQRRKAEMRTHDESKPQSIANEQNIVTSPILNKQTSVNSQALLETNTRLQVQPQEVEMMEVETQPAEINQATVQPIIVTPISQTTNAVMLNQNIASQQVTTAGEIRDEPAEERVEELSAIVSSVNPLKIEFRKNVEITADHQNVATDQKHEETHRHGFDISRVKVRSGHRGKEKRKENRHRRTETSNTQRHNSKIRTDEPRGNYSSKYVQTYRTRRFRQLKVVQASINPPES